MCNFSFNDVYCNNLCLDQSTVCFDLCFNCLVPFGSLMMLSTHSRLTWMSQGFWFSAVIRVLCWSTFCSDWQQGGPATVGGGADLGPSVMALWPGSPQETFVPIEWNSLRNGGLQSLAHKCSLSWGDGTKRKKEWETHRQITRQGRGERNIPFIEKNRTENRARKRKSAPFWETMFKEEQENLKVEKNALYGCFSILQHHWQFICYKIIVHFYDGRLDDHYRVG